MTADEYNEKMKAWLSAAVDALIAKGATLADIKEEAFAQLVATKVLETHSEEMNEPEFFRHTLDRLLKESPPEKLRQMAAAARERRFYDFAYDLEHIADLRERGDYDSASPEPGTS
jgi:hypothetical protein